MGLWVCNNNHNKNSPVADPSGKSTRERYTFLDQVAGQMELLNTFSSGSLTQTGIWRQAMIYTIDGCNSFMCPHEGVEPLTTYHPVRGRDRSIF
jgi:hypothetical protein